MPVGKPQVAIIDSKSLRRASLISFFQQWAHSEELMLTPFDVVEACEALQAQADIRMLIVNVGGCSIAEPENLQTFMMLRGQSGGVPLIIISDRDDPQEIAAAVAAEITGFVPTGMDANLACKALSFILHGGSYFPQAAIRQLQRQSAQNRSQEETHAPKSDQNGHRMKSKLTGREGEVLERVRFGDSNKMIARELGMTEATVKVYVGQLMRKFGATNRTQLALVGNQGFAPDCTGLIDASLTEECTNSTELEKKERNEPMLRLDNTLSR
ncbi:LuxR C-terminal-related transcriptional regulator [Bradyrhizobium sp. STM 3561]|uniref:helix-turn-helix transcriptional regulator n=1 Tax=Bradyrhizobium sp. STM 3561 TaxID=578923 RepID=UPI00388CEF2C